MLNTEYFVDDMKAQGVKLRKSFYLFSIVDFDPSGWIIRNAFVNNLKFYGIPNIKVTDLITPDRLTAEEARHSRFQIPDSESMKSKNEDWLFESSA